MNLILSLVNTSSHSSEKSFRIFPSLFIETNLISIIISVAFFSFDIYKSSIDKKERLPNDSCKAFRIVVFPVLFVPVRTVIGVKLISKSSNPLKPEILILSINIFPMILLVFDTKKIFCIISDILYIFYHEHCRYFTFSKFNRYNFSRSLKSQMFL